LVLFDTFAVSSMRKKPACGFASFFSI
jgi:hypothetical protein